VSGGVKGYDNPKKECNTMQKSMKKITYEKEWDIGTDHQCKVENVQQCRQVSEQEKVRECNLVNNPICYGIHGDEVLSMQCKNVPKEKCCDEPGQPCKQVPKEKVGMNLVKYNRIFQVENIRTSLDKNAMMYKERVT